MQASTIHHESHREDEDYRALLAQLHTALDGHEGPLFTTNAKGLFDVFLESLPADRRQHYNCRSCRRFIDRFGGLVRVFDDGAAPYAMWRPGSLSYGFFGDAVDAIKHVVLRSRITGVFLCEDPIWGTPSSTAKNGPRAGIEWHHMHVVPPVSLVCRLSALHTPSQVMAERYEEYAMLSRGLVEFSIDHVRQAHALLTTGGLCRSEKCIGIARWLLDLHEAREATKNKVARENLVWRAVALAPPGYAHVRTTMIATLLEDIAAGKAFEDIRRSFDAKMSPIQYQRPQAAPTDGQLAAAEKIVQKLASAGSLARRFARLDEIAPHAIWMPKVTGAPKAEGVFGHLRSVKAPSAVDVPAQTITWEKFARTVLPDAERIEYLVPRAPAPFFAFVTAENAAAPPILQWDREDARNPVSWYVYNNGSLGRAWALPEGECVDVVALVKQPSGWGTGEFAHQGDGAYFVLRGARDTVGGSSGLFPEILRGEYREIRSALEAYSRNRPLAKTEDAASGVCMQKSSGGGLGPLRVTTKGTRASYRIDRWD